MAGVKYLGCEGFQLDVSLMMKLTIYLTDVLTQLVHSVKLG